VAGGKVIIYGQGGGGGLSESVTSGSLQANTNTPTPGDYSLMFITESNWVFVADLAIDTIADGTIDVRGVANSWPSGTVGGSLNISDTFTIERVGNTKLVVPGS
jgi:hypothetical protein